MSKKKPDLTEDPILPTLLKLTWPMIFGMLGSVLFNLADTYFLGRVGVNELAAMGFTFPAVMFVSSVAAGVGIGTASLFSRAIVVKKLSEVQRYSTSIFILALLVIVIFIALGLWTLKPLFRLLGAGEEIIPLIADYMTIWYWAVFLVVIPMVGNNMIRATGNMFAPGMIMVFGNVINIILDPLFIFGMGPFPEMGIKGAALATAISMGSTCILSLYILIKKERLLVLVWPVFKEMIDVWKQVLAVGIPAAMAILITPLSIGFITRILAGFGPDAVAAFGVVSRLEMFAFTLIYALGSVLTVFAGQNWSARKPGRLRKGINISAQFSLGLGLFFFVISQLFASGIASVFTDSKSVIEIAASYLTIVSFSYGFQGILMLCTSTLDGINRPLVSFSLSLLRMLVLYVPLAWLTSNAFGLNGIFWSAFTANLAAGTVAWYWLQKIISKQTTVIKQPEQKQEMLFAAK
ncbi:MAG: MATE family efflux transporter [Balneolaceae bacterium]